jgi:hypothetical protein
MISFNLPYRKLGPEMQKQLTRAKDRKNNKAFYANKTCNSSKPLFKRHSNFHTIGNFSHLPFPVAQ